MSSNTISYIADGEKNTVRYLKEIDKNLIKDIEKLNSDKKFFLFMMKKFLKNLLIRLKQILN